MNRRKRPPAVRVKLHSLVTLAAPHLSTVLGDSPLVAAGMRAMWYLKGHAALPQMVLEEGWVPELVWGV